MARRAPVHRQGPTHPKFKAQEAEAAKEYDRQRGSAAKRGYDRKWQRFRRWYLRHHPLCAKCVRAAATEVHHLRGLREHPEDKCKPEQVEALCKPCHSQETAQNLGRGMGRK